MSSDVIGKNRHQHRDDIVRARDKQRPTSGMRKETDNVGWPSVRVVNCVQVVEEEAVGEEANLIRSRQRQLVKVLRFCHVTTSINGVEDSADVTHREGVEDSANMTKGRLSKAKEKIVDKADQSYISWYQSIVKAFFGETMGKKCDIINLHQSTIGEEENIMASGDKQHGMFETTWSRHGISSDQHRRAKLTPTSRMRKETDNVGRLKEMAVAWLREQWPRLAGNFFDKLLKKKRWVKRPTELPIEAVSEGLRQLRLYILVREALANQQNCRSRQLTQLVKALRFRQVTASIDGVEAAEVTQREGVEEFADMTKGRLSKVKGKIVSGSNPMPLNFRVHHGPRPSFGNRVDTHVSKRNQQITQNIPSRGIVDVVNKAITEILEGKTVLASVSLVANPPQVERLTVYLVANKLRHE
eukprot:Gb_23618 [translate_table: standard]